MLTATKQSRRAMISNIKPDDLRALANVASLNADWVARAKAALVEAAEQWEWAELQILDEIEIATYGSD
jgi:acyl-CoA reductase-like NAD-dependent aldehyde dehydrogenase